MHAKVTWSNGLSFTGEADSGFSVRLGGERSVGGEEDGLRPMELIAIGIAGCTAMDVISILQKKKQRIAAFEVVVRAPRAQDHPKVFTKMDIEYIVAGDQVEEAAVQRAIQLSEEKYCPAIAMFQNVAPMNLTYRIEDNVA